MFGLSGSKRNARINQRRTQQRGSYSDYRRGWDEGRRVGYDQGYRDAQKARDEQ